MAATYQVAKFTRSCIMVDIILLVISLCLLVAEAFQVKAPISLGWLGLALFVLTFII